MPLCSPVFSHLPARPRSPPRPRRRPVASRVHLPPPPARPARFLRFFRPPPPSHVVPARARMGGGGGAAAPLFSQIRTAPLPASPTPAALSPPAPAFPACATHRPIPPRGLPGGVRRGGRGAHGPSPPAPSARASARSSPPSSPLSPSLSPSCLRPPTSPMPCAPSPPTSPELSPASPPPPRGASRSTASSSPCLHPRGRAGFASSRALRLCTPSMASPPPHPPHCAAALLLLSRSATSSAPLMYSSPEMSVYNIRINQRLLDCTYCGQPLRPDTLDGKAWKCAGVHIFCRACVSRHEQACISYCSSLDQIISKMKFKCNCCDSEYIPYHEIEGHMCDINILVHHEFFAVRDYGECIIDTSALVCSECRLPLRPPIFRHLLPSW
ncbi:hypothetical protein PVAP13_7KG075709 [Panicum virgatum]|uniref:Uncharacterized protein n=1 Tax=Panicum virgatum TaxID=38727 RepID=A0A8T0QJH4_PANVG|nr:hypothetical protein PVAP13_7KG075709 [Panicum virgatum]